MKPAVIAVLLAASACTTLGPMPASTMVSAVPANRPGVEVMAGAAPGFMLSDATHDAHGTALGQISGLVEPDRWLGVKGVIVGVRQAGNEDNTITEPFAGYRRQIDENLAVAGIGYGTHASGASGTASYEASRVGAEVAVDAKLASNSWIGLHVQASASATLIDASGTYCENVDGTGIDCDEDAMDHVVDATVHGVYANASTGVSIDLFRRPEGFVHSMRFAAMVSLGAMPRVRYADQERGDTYVSGGASLTVGIGD